MIYVLYADSSGMGKTYAAQTLLKHRFVLLSEEGEETFLEGIMMTGTNTDTNYCSSLAAQLGMSTTPGWMYPFLLAMDRPNREDPSILILDLFNSHGLENANIHFLKAMYGAINGQRNMHVLVITQNHELANKICKLNGGGSRSCATPCLLQPRR